MIGIIAYFSLKDTIANNKKLFKQWINRFIYPLQTYNGTYFYLIVNKLETTPTWTTDQIIFKKVRSFTEIKEIHPQAHFVGLTATADTLLQHYNHPKEDVFYVVGGDYGEISFNEFNGIIHDFVKIQTNEQIPLWADQALAIVLHDRDVKLNG